MFSIAIQDRGRKRSDGRERGRSLVGETAAKAACQLFAGGIGGATDRRGTSFQWGQTFFNAASNTSVTSVIDTTVSVGTATKFDEAKVARFVTGDRTIGADSVELAGNVDA